MWEQREDGLWLREDYWPAKREVGYIGCPPSLTKAEQERVIMLIRQGMPLEKIAELFKTSYDTIRRLANSQGIELQRSERKLSSEQLSEAYDLLRADVPFREVARQYEIHPESLRRLVVRDGVEVRTKGETLTPEQLQKVHDLIGEGMSVRQVAKQVGISRGGRVVEGKKREVIKNSECFQKSKSVCCTPSQPSNNGRRVALTL